MTTKHVRLSFLLFLILSVAADNIKNSSTMYLKEVLKLLDKVVDYMLMPKLAYKMNLKPSYLGRQLEEEIEKVEKKLLYYDKFEEINVKIDTIDKTLKEIKSTSIILNETWDLRKIESYYQNYTKFVRNPPKVDDQEISQFLWKCTFDDGERDSPKQIIAKIFANLIPDLRAYLNNQGSICQTKHSQKEVMKSMFELFFLNEIKVYAMIQFSYAILQKFRSIPLSYITEIKRTKSEHKSRVDHLSRTFKSLTNKASSLLYNCDPPNRTNEYAEMTRLIQGFIINQQNLDQNGQCFSTCSSYKHVNKTYNCDDDSWCSHGKSCKTMFDCKSIPNAEVCRSKTETKRYDKVDASGMISYNNEHSCQTQSLDRSSYELFWECAYCFCSCDEGPSISSDRYISLRAASSDFINNRVVVGVRFIKHNRIIHLQVQEGQLGPYGFINPDTVRWVKPNSFKITDRKTSEGKDYHTFSMKERAIDLDNIIVPEDVIVTGVRFQIIGTHIQLQVLKSGFNFKTGVVDPIYNEYIQPPLIEKKRVNIENALPPNKCVSDVYYGHNKYVEFSHSDVKTDAGQTTVPFFDLQPVNSKIPLSGVGLHYRGNSEGNCGGFIAPHIHTYRNSKIFDTILN